MSPIIRLLFAIIFILFLELSTGQELTAEVLNVRLPLPITFSATVYDGKDTVYIIGGTDPEDNARREILKFSVTNETLIPMALLPLARYYGGAVIDDQGENIYYFGGTIEEHDQSDIFKFNIQTNAVTIVGNLSEPTSAPAVFKYTTGNSSKVFIIGGNLDYQKSVQCWDIELEENCPTKTIDTDFYNPAVVTYGNEAFLFGDANNTIQDVPIYKINLDTFETSFGENILPAFALLPEAVVSGKNAYIIGGWDPQINFEANSIIKVDLETSETTVYSVNNFINDAIYVWSVSAVLVEKTNRIYVFGGYSLPHGFHDDIWSIDLSPVYN